MGYSVCENLRPSGAAGNRILGFRADAEKADIIHGQTQGLPLRLRFTFVIFLFGGFSVNKKATGLPLLVMTAFKIALFDGFAFVVELLAFGEGHVHFRQAFFIDKDARRYHRQPLVFQFQLQLFQFPLFQQQFTVTRGIMIGVGAFFIRRNVQMMHEQLAVLKNTVGIGQVDFSLPNGFYFGARQHYSGRVGLQKEVLKRGAAVTYINGSAHFYTINEEYLEGDESNILASPTSFLTSVLFF